MVCWLNNSLVTCCTGIPFVAKDEPGYSMYTALLVRKDGVSTKYVHPRQHSTVVLAV